MPALLFALAYGSPRLGLGPLAKRWRSAGHRNPSTVSYQCYRLRYRTLGLVQTERWPDGTLQYRAVVRHPVPPDEWRGKVSALACKPRVEGKVQTQTSSLMPTTRTLTSYKSHKNKY